MIEHDGVVMRAVALFSILATGEIFYFMRPKSAPIALKEILKIFFYQASVKRKLFWLISKSKEGVLRIER